MSPRFFHYLKIVAAVHVVIAVVAITVSSWRGCLRKKDAAPLPVEFIVEAPRVAATPELPPEKILPPKLPDPVKPPSKPDKPKKPRPRKKIKVSDKIVERRTGPPPKKPMSDKKIKELLSKGAKLGDHTSIPDDEARCLARIHDVLYTAWIDRPSAVDVGDAVSKVRFDLTGDGSIKAREMVKKSGNPTMDSSVMKAANAVVRITGLSAAFLDRHDHNVTVSFRLE